MKYGPVLLSVLFLVVTLSAQEITCAGRGYTRASCGPESQRLQSVLTDLHAENLPIHWCIVREDHWRTFAVSMRFNPEIPSAAAVESQMVVIEEALVDGQPMRAKQISELYQISQQRMLKVAVAHELVHTVCHTKDESLVWSLTARMQQEGAERFRCR